MEFYTSPKQLNMHVGGNKLFCAAAMQFNVEMDYSCCLLLKLNLEVIPSDPFFALSVAMPLMRFLNGM